MDAAFIDEVERTTVAAGYLRNNALQVYRQAAEAGNLNWKQFKDLMIRKFSRKDTETELIKQLMELKQSNTVTNYIEKFTYFKHQQSQKASKYIC